MLDKLPGLWYSDHRPGNYNYIACKELGRDFIGCEIDDGYFEIAERRLA